MRYKHIISFLISSLIVTDLRNFLLVTFLLAFSCVFERFFLCAMWKILSNHVFCDEKSRKNFVSIVGAFKKLIFTRKEIFFLFLCENEHKTHRQCIIKISHTPPPNISQDVLHPISLCNDSLWQICFCKNFRQSCEQERNWAIKNIYHERDFNTHSTPGD